MNKMEILNKIEKRMNKAWNEFKAYCLENNNPTLDEKADLKASQLHAKWEALEDLYDDLAEEL